MVRLSRWLFLLLLLTLASGGGRLWAAGSGENRAFGLATNGFRDGFWEQAEKDFSAFTNKYPASEYIPEAILYQGRARFQLKQFTNSVQLLSANLGKAGRFGDQYWYWIGRSHFENTNYPAATNAFEELIRDFPDSPLRLEAAIREASACARLEDWPHLLQLLERPDGVFQQTVRAGHTADKLVGFGYLLLTEAHLSLKNFGAAQAAWRLSEPLVLDPDAAWLRQYLQCRLLRDQGQLEEARRCATNLPVAVNATDRSEGVAFEAGVLEELHQYSAAIAAYGKNLQADVPPKQQRRALLKLAELALVQNEFAYAAQMLDRFLAQFPGNNIADLATLTVGELRLRQALSGGETNRAKPDPELLDRALKQFDALLNRFPDSSLAGKALLNKGWCLWLRDEIAGSAEQFRLATIRLPFSEDQAVARFKWADAQFQLKDPGAIANYEFIVDHYGGLPAVRKQLLEPALYQTVRAALQADNLVSTTNALRKILDWYPKGFAGPSALLLTGQGLALRKDTAAARQWLVEFELRYSTNALVPEVRLAIARTYEEEGDWDMAIAHYADWLATFTNHAERPQAEYWRAWDTYMVGQETNALRLFTNFVAQFPTNELAAHAQWWIGGFYFSHRDFLAAENNYQRIYQNTNWPVTELTCQAKMMAGRAAVARERYKDAISYFTNLISDATCPSDLKVQAAFAAGDAWMSRRDLPETNLQANLEEAKGWFETATNAQPALAWGKIGACYLQMAAGDDRYYATASNVYQRVIELPQVSSWARAQAKVGRALVAEMQARQGGDDEVALLKVALADYLEVFYDPDLREGGKPELLFWTKKAGLDAGRLAETLQEWQPAINVYSQLKCLLPPFRPTAENKIQKVLLEKCPECKVPPCVEDVVKQAEAGPR